MSVQLYYAEAVGARILAANQGISQLDTNYDAEIYTWDIAPAGEVGDVMWRTIDVSGTCTNGYSLGVTPIVDGVALQEQLFSGAGSGEFQVQAFIATRGTRAAAKLRTVTRAGDIEIHNISTAYKILRRVP